MAYQARRRKRFEEDFELVDENGKVAHTIKVSLDADDMIMKINRKYTDLTMALNEIGNTNETKTHEEANDKLEKIGRAVVDLLESVFGEKDTKTIVDFYENRYMEMAEEVIPFITTVVIPRLSEIRKQKRRDAIAGYTGESFSFWRQR